MLAYRYHHERRPPHIAPAQFPEWKAAASPPDEEEQREAQEREAARLAEETVSKGLVGMHLMRVLSRQWGMCRPVQAVECMLAYGLAWAVRKSSTEVTCARVGGAVVADWGC